MQKSMTKNEIIAKEIISLLETDKAAGKEFVIYSSKDIKELLSIDTRFSPNRYPMICQAIDKALQTVPGEHISGTNPSANYTVKFKLIWIN